MLSSASNGEAPSRIATSTGRLWIRWTGFWRHRHSGAVVDTEEFVAAWKAAWMKGAEARWHATASEANPHVAGQERAAWNAGWRWAQENPDRRHNDMSRLAHRYRRANDSTGSLTRALQLGALGFTIFWVSRALHRWARRAD